MKTKSMIDPAKLMELKRKTKCISHAKVRHPSPPVPQLGGAGSDASDGESWGSYISKSIKNTCKHWGKFEWLSFIAFCAVIVFLISRYSEKKNRNVQIYHPGQYYNTQEEEGGYNDESVHENSFSEREIEHEFSENDLIQDEDTMNPGMNPGMTSGNSLSPEPFIL